MNAYGAELWGAPGASTPNSKLRIRRTNSEFVVTDTSDRLHRITLERTLKAMAFLVVLLAGVILIMAEPTGGSASAFPMLGLASAMVVVALALFAYAHRGLGDELHVDSYRREIRVGTVNAKGDFRTRKTISANEVQSFFLMRAVAPAPAFLCMRRKTGDQVVKIMKGPEAELVPVLERIIESFRPPNMANKRVRTRVTGAFIHASFR